MDLKRYLELDRILPAFRPADLQTAATLYSWIRSHKFTMEELCSYTVMFPVMRTVHEIGYFAITPSVEHQKRMREFERTLPKDLRKTLRAERLFRSPTGYLHE
jgi:hypothetical protein